MNGAHGAEGIRTPDLHTASVALSQLSYSPGTPAFRDQDPETIGQPDLRTCPEWAREDSNL